MTVETQVLVSEAAVVFDGGEQFAADLPSYNAGQELLQKHFGFAQIATVQQGDQLLWQAQKGQLQLGQRTLIVDSAKGSPRLLGIAVRGKTADAFDVLQELWTRLVERERTLNPTTSETGQAATEAGRIQSLGRPIVHTIAVVKLPFRVEQLFPQAEFLREQVKDGVDTSFRISREPTVRFSFELRLEWGLAHRNLTSQVTFEPRVGDKLDSRLFFTRSPLPSDEHMKVVERFVEKFAPRAAG